MAKPSTTAADIGSLKKLRPAVEKLIMEERWNLQLARELYELRQKSGLSIRQLALRTHVKASTIQRLEDADPRWVTLPQVLRIVHALGAKLTVSRLVPRWFALVHEGRILQETFALDAADALMKIRELRGKLPLGATLEKSTGKNQLEYAPEEATAKSAPHWRKHN